MGKQILSILCFCMLMLIVASIFLFINSTTPVLLSGAMLPEDIASRHYTLVPTEKDGARHFVLRTQTVCNEDIVLALSDMGAIHATQGGSVLYESQPEDAYRRVQRVVIPRETVNQSQGFDIVVDSVTRYDSAREVITGTSITLSKALVTTTSWAERAQNMAFGVSMLTMGIYLLAFVVCLTLYIGKPTEKYLLLLALVSLICAVTSLFTTNNPLLSISYSQYSVLRPLLSICPLMINAAVCLYLCEDCLPRRIRVFLSIPMLLLMTVALVLLRATMRLSIYTAVRLALIVPVSWTLSRACRRKMWGAALLIIGYAVSEAFIITLFVINNLHLFRPGTMMTWLNITHLSFLPMLLCALLVVSHRFAAKFRESESLARKLRVMNASLDQTVEERTRELTQEQERRRNMMLNVIHDIRSPVFILQGNLDQLHVAEEERPLRDVMRRKLSDLKRLVEDLFMSAKLEDEGVFYEEDRLEAGRIVTELYEENCAEAAQRGVKLTLNADSGTAIVWADRLRLRQAIQNLVDNAFTYTPPGGEISLAFDASTAEAVIRVTNTGKGIAADDLPYVFERYFSAARMDNPKSSGLGLSICKEIVGHFQGEITVTSQREKKTTFEIRLPTLPGENARAERDIQTAVNAES